MNEFRKGGLRTRITVAFVGAAVVMFLAALLGIIFYQSLLLESRVRQTLEPYADMVSVSASPAAEFGDSARALEILRSLGNNPHPQIVRADLVVNHVPLATFPADAPPLPVSKQRRMDGIYLEAGRADLVRSFTTADGKVACLTLEMSLDQLKARNRQTLFLTGLAGFAAMLVATMVQLLVLRRSVVEPLEKLTGSVDRLRHDANYRMRLAETGNDEYAVLGRNFNLLLTQVEFRESSLNRLTKFQRAILDNAAYAIISTTAEGVITSFNPAAEKLLGYKADEMVGRQTPEVFHDPDEVRARARELTGQLGADVPPGFETFVALARRNIACEIEWTYVRKDGSRLPVLLSVTALRDDADQITGFLGMAVDITVRKKLEAESRQKTSLLQATLQATADGILVVSGNGKITSYNKQLVELWRVPQAILDSDDALLLGEYLLNQLRHPFAMAKRMQQFNDISKSETFDVLEFADGRILERFSRPQFVEGQVVGRVWSFRDVTAARRAEAALRENEYKFKTLFETANDAILLMNQTVFLDCNRKAEKTFGCDRNKLIGTSLIDFSPEHQADGGPSRVKAAEKINAALAGQTQFFEWIHCRADGTPFNAEVSLNRLELHGKPVLQAIVRDITARKQAETAQREAEELYRTLVNTSPDGIAVMDMEGRIRFASPKDLEMYGLPDMDAKLGRHALEFVAPGEQERVKQAMLQAFMGNIEHNQRFMMLRADGSQFMAEVNGTLLRDGLGVASGLMVVTRDVTDRQRQEDELKHKNEELERFTYTVSHDLKSPLITIKGFAGALLADAKAGRTDRLADDLKRVMAAAGKMGQLLNGLLELSRVGRIVNPPVQVALTRLADDVVELLSGSIQERGARVTVQRDLPAVSGDPQRLQQVFQNLIENALKFGRDNHPPVIEVGAKIEAGIPVFFVRDDGRGIEPRFRDTVFGLFNKLDARSEGTGIGLALVRRIVEFHGGRIWVEAGENGRGTVFYFTLTPGGATSGGSQP